MSSLKNVKFAGCLYHKGMLSWTQRYCVIADGQLVSYRSEKDAKPLLSLPLAGRDITYTERMDSSRFSHALRVSRPGSETHWFYTDTRDVADAWIFVSISLCLSLSLSVCACVCFIFCLSSLVVDNMMLYIRRVDFINHFCSNKCARLVTHEQTGNNNDAKSVKFHWQV